MADMSVFNQQMSMLQSHWIQTANPQSQYYDEQSRDFYQDMLEKMVRAKMFIVDNMKSWLFQNTKPMKLKLTEMKMVFPLMYVSDRIRVNDEYYINGVMLTTDKETNICHVIGSVIPYSSVDHTFLSTTITFRIDLVNSEIPKVTRMKVGKRKIILKDRLLKLAEKMAHHYILNLILFLNEPRVAVVVQERQNNAKREARGKTSIPDLIVTTIQKEFVDYIYRSYTKHTTERTLNYSFMVRPHWRELRHERYGANIGKRLWIDAFRKGDGPLVPQIWRVK